jgi:hypothetical protein
VEKSKRKDDGFKLLMRNLENDYVLGMNKYPAMLAESIASVDGVF